MNTKFYKYCIVPLCGNTTIKTPNKLFIYVPNKKEIRRKWLQLARLDPNSLSIDSRMYFCEDHFDLPNDMENYMEYHIKGFVSQIRMKRGSLPKKFECQPDRKKRTGSSTERPYIHKKQRISTIEECLSKPSTNKIDSLEQCTPSTSTHTRSIVTEETSDKNSESLRTKGVVEDASKTADKSIQVLLTHKFRSKAVQTSNNLVDQALSPLKISCTSVSTSPFKVIHTSKAKPVQFNASNIAKKILFEEDRSDSDVSLFTPSVCGGTESSPSTHSLEIQSSDCSELVSEKQKEKIAETIQNTITKIKNRPRFYIGVPKNYSYLIDIIMSETQIPEHHLLLCLKKIRLDNTFQELADDFGISVSYASKIFLKNIPLIASVMRPFIVKLDSQMTKKTLPMAFRHKYYNVSCIIDCLEIDIQKPSKAVNQALTWSDYKKANTIKYLVSCTPNGLVNYISPGFGGRTTDTCLVETCDFTQSLEKGMCVMADRGFKHVEQYLHKSGVQLVRPPSVQTGVKLTKSESKETKQIASLRIHVERVIRRLREFYMLKPHACININFIKVLDDIITIACALINLQDSLIK